MASCPWRKGLARFGSPLRTYTTSGSKERNMKPTAPKLIRWAGLSAMAAGIIFLVILPIQPPYVLSSVTTPAWAIVQSAEVAMCLLERVMNLAEDAVRLLEEKASECDEVQPRHRFGQPLVILHQPPKARCPREIAFHHPSPRQ
jgi:hypothetical protein